jgi:hypothetical protein
MITANGNNALAPWVPYTRAGCDDLAPTSYIDPTGPATAREFERAAANITALDPFNGQTVHLARYLAHPVEMKLLPMITGDPQRTPNFVIFGNPIISSSPLARPLSSSIPASPGTMAVWILESIARSSSWSDREYPNRVCKTSLGLTTPTFVQPCSCSPD